MRILHSKDLHTAILPQQNSDNQPLLTTSKDIENKLFALKPALSTRFFVGKIGYFGSFVRNEQTETSDVDILVSFHKPLGWAFFDLQELLEEELQRKVDLVSVNALKVQLKDIILSEVKYI